MSIADPRYDEDYWENGIGSNYRAYADDPGWGPTAALLRAAVGSTEPYPTLLEVGCAKGYFVAAAQRAGFDAIGVDPSRWALDHPAPGTEGRLYPGKAETLTADGLHDVVCSWEVLEHIDEALVPEALTRMWARLLDGGLFVHRICLPGAMHDEDATHVTVKPREWWEAYLDEQFGAHRRERWLERAFDNLFAGRDWAGRYFAYRR